MTNQGDHGSGSSLLQTRGTHSNHNHQHLHLHQHRRLHTLGADTAPTHIRSPTNEKLHDRQVVIIQTVSVVHYIDATGAVTSVDTLDSDTVTPIAADPPAAVTAAGLTALGDALPSVSLSDLLSDLVDGAPSSTASAESAPSPLLSASSDTLTSTLSTFSSSSSAFPTLSGVFNSTSSRISSLFGNHTVGLLSNYTRTSTSNRSTFASTSTSTSTGSSSSLWSSTTDLSAPTVVVAGDGGGGGNGGSAATSTAPGPAESTTEAPAGLAPEQRNAVVGGVVGSVAGIALVALIFLYLLKWRRQRGQGIMLLGDGDSTARGFGFGFGGPGSPSGGRDMAERSGAFAIPSALASLTGKRAIDAPPAEPATQERGFYRVSGRKLVSVLESGGDGYSDPHDSIGSASSYYRDSTAFVDGSNLQPLQLGSPMRPVSGVPVFRDGPQRTPVHEDIPLTPGHRPPAFPIAPRTPHAVGGTFSSRDGSRGSQSRFTEDA